MSDEIKVLRMPQVIKKVGLQKTAIYDMIKAGNFPKPFPLGDRAKGWLLSDIDDWIMRIAGKATANDGRHDKAA